MQQQPFIGAKYPAKCVKNEIHNLLTVLRLTKHRSSVHPEARFHYQVLRSFQELFEELTYINELNEFDTIAYLEPFLRVIQSPDTDGQITAVALGAVNKFVSFGLIHPDSPRCMDAINTLAWGVIHCRFVSSGSANDEVVLLKIVGLLLDCLRCPAGWYLNDDCVWHMVRKCYQISRQPRASHLLRSSSEGVLLQMILTIFGTHHTRSRKIIVKEEYGASDGAALDKKNRQVYKPYGFPCMLYMLKFLAFLMSYGRQGGAPASAKAKPKARPVTPTKQRQRSRSPTPRRPESPTHEGDSSNRSFERQSSATSADLELTEEKTDTKPELCEEMQSLGLSLLNVALETGGDQMLQSEELIAVIQDDICKALLHNSRSESLSLLSVTLRAVFNLFQHFKKHLKVQLEIFFSSIHLKIAAPDSGASYEQRELALESLLEFCREPELMIELYENYDCDCQCTNLFETLVRFLVRHAYPSEHEKGALQGFNPLHRLALSGLLSILHSLAIRCEKHQGAWEEMQKSHGKDTSSSENSCSTDLERKKERKNRLTLASRTFNSDPYKCTSVLQTLGFVSNPQTPESMAEFLRHTPGLDMRVVGEYLSKRKDFNHLVREAFIDAFSFQGMSLVEALRSLLSSFRLPGEAQLIERIIESFANAYFKKQAPVDGDDRDRLSDGGSTTCTNGSAEVGGFNAVGAAVDDLATDPKKIPRWVPREKQPDEADDIIIDEADFSEMDAAGKAAALGRFPITNSDTIFILSYSIIMLNTDLHNPQVKNRMTPEQFCKNNRGINDGKDLPDVFLHDIYENIRDNEIRLFGDSVVGADGGSTGASLDAVDDDFFWDGILKRGENIEEFSTTASAMVLQNPPGNTERVMFQTLMDTAPLPTVSLCYESVPDPAVTVQAMQAFRDLTQISYYFEQADQVKSLVRVLCQYFSKGSITPGPLSLRTQVALDAALRCSVQYTQLFQQQQWEVVLDVLLKCWALDLLPVQLTEFDDFTNTEGKPLSSLCDLTPPLAVAAPASKRPSNEHAEVREQKPDHMGLPGPGGDGFLETLTRWFDEDMGDDEIVGHLDGRISESHEPNDAEMVAQRLTLRRATSQDSIEVGLPLLSDDAAEVHQKVRMQLEVAGFVELFSQSGLSKLSAESLQHLAKALVLLSRPKSWAPQSPTAAEVNPNGMDAEKLDDSSPTAAAQNQRSGLDIKIAKWREMADPVFGLELLTNMTCMPLKGGQNISVIWPLVSTHFERLLQHVVSSGGSTDAQFTERLIVNTLRLGIRQFGHPELVSSLLSLLQYLGKLSPSLLEEYSERIACGLLLLLKQGSLPLSGLHIIFSLLKRISEFPNQQGTGIAGIECLNFWINDEQEMANLLSLQLYPEILSTLMSFAFQNGTQASSTALCHLSELVPRLSKSCGPGDVEEAQWLSLLIPTLHALSNVAAYGPQKSRARAFVFLQRLLLEKGTDLSLPWAEIPFGKWKECLEQVLFPLLTRPDDQAPADDDGMRKANAAQLLCRVVLNHYPDWLTKKEETFPTLCLRLMHIVVHEAHQESDDLAKDSHLQSLKNLLLVVSTDPQFSSLRLQTGEALVDAMWGVVSSTLGPQLQQEITMILNPPGPDDEPQPVVSPAKDAPSASLPAVPEVPAASASVPASPQPAGAVASASPSPGIVPAAPEAPTMPPLQAGATAMPSPQIGAMPGAPLPTQDMASVPGFSMAQAPPGSAAQYTAPTMFMPMQTPVQSQAAVLMPGMTAPYTAPAMPAIEVQSQAAMPMPGMTAPYTAPVMPAMAMPMPGIPGAPVAPAPQFSMQAPVPEMQFPGVTHYGMPAVPSVPGLPTMQMPSGLPTMQMPSGMPSLEQLPVAAATGYPQQGISFNVSAPGAPPAQWAPAAVLAPTEESTSVDLT